MPRSVWKGPFVDDYVLRLTKKHKDSKSHKPIEIRSRRSTILPMCVGLVYSVYNGCKFIPVSVNEDMVGRKFGEFSPTRTYNGHAADKKAKRK